MHGKRAAGFLWTALHPMVAPLCAILVLVLMWAAETLHQRRVTSLASLAFGPDGKPAFLGRVLPWLKAPAAALATWGLLVLATMPPKVHPPEEASEGEIKHVMMILDVSPSMQLIDAGKEGMISRRKQCATLMQSFFRRVIMEQVRLSVIAVYTGAKPVVVDTRDVEVVRNILNDLPMSHAFDPGQTQLFSGLEEAIGICRPWAKDSTTLIILSDGDTLPAIGMPSLPPSVSDVLVVGVGDPHQGSFINGYQSKQENSTLRQMAARLGGVYHDGNARHIQSDVLERMMNAGKEGSAIRLTLREFALMAASIGSLLLATTPFLLAWGGTRYLPGMPAEA